MTTKYKIGQKVKGGTGTRTIVKTSDTNIYWRSGKKAGKCSRDTFKRWIAGN